MRSSKIIIILMALAFLALSVTSGFSAHPVLGGGMGKGGGPVNTITGTTMGEGMWGLSLQMGYTGFDSYSKNEMEGFAGEDREIHNTDDVRSYSVGVATGITDYVTAHLSIPYATQSGIRESEPPDEIHEHGNSRGIGDIAFHVNHMAVHMPNQGFHVAVIYGLKMPTGQTNIKDKNGERFEAEFQPGSGSWDPMIGVAVTEDYGPFSAHANLHYTLVTEGIQETDLGDRFNYNVALVYRTAPPIRMNFFVEANGLWQDKEEVSSVEDSNSGGNIVMLSPGVRVNFTPAVSGYFSYGFPIYQDLNGEQNDVEYRMVAGISMAL